MKRTGIPGVYLPPELADGLESYEQGLRRWFLIVFGLVAADTAVIFLIILLLWLIGVK